MEKISWAELLRVPDPVAHTTIFLHVLVRFWAASNSSGGNLELPRDVSDVVLRADHGLVGKKRFHLHEVVPGDRVGVWDETPFWVGFCSNNTSVFDHGDFRHAFQLFLRSFLRHTDGHVSLARLRALVAASPVLRWNCSLCRSYNDWSVGFMRGSLVAQPDALHFLLTHQNRFDGGVASGGGGVVALMESSLTRFFSGFNKVCEQTSAEPVDILANLIRVLDGYVGAHTTERLHEFEHACARDMKSYLYKEFKFLRTCSVHVSSFPRDMMIARDLFPMIAASWADPVASGTSPGLLFLLCQMLLEDRILSCSSLDCALVCSGDGGVRAMTSSEAGVLAHYHPLLRHEVFVDC